jgi:hypothetical protein
MDSGARRGWMGMGLGVVVAEGVKGAGVWVAVSGFGNGVQYI